MTSFLEERFLVKITDQVAIDDIDEERDRRQTQRERERECK